MINTTTMMQLRFSTQKIFPPFNKNGFYLTEGPRGDPRQKMAILRFFFPI